MTTGGNILSKIIAAMAYATKYFINWIIKFLYTKDEIEDEGTETEASRKYKEGRSQMTATQLAHQQQMWGLTYYGIPIVSLHTKIACFFASFFSLKKK